MEDLFPIAAGTKALGTQGGSLGHTHTVSGEAHLTLAASSIWGDRTSNSYTSDWTVTGVSGSSGSVSQTLGTVVSGDAATANVLPSWRAVNFFIKARA